MFEISWVDVGNSLVASAIWALIALAAGAVTGGLFGFARGKRRVLRGIRDTLDTVDLDAARLALEQAAEDCEVARTALATSPAGLADTVTELRAAIQQAVTTHRRGIDPTDMPGLILQYLRRERIRGL